MFTSHIQILGAERRVLAFGTLANFLSSPGQTFFIAVFIGSLSASTGLDAGDLGSLYLAGALGSAALLPALGHWIDRIDLRVYAGLVCAGLALACLWAASVTGPIGLFFAFLLLRLFGQGLMTHVSITSVARYFGSSRGLALSLTSMGFALATAVLPSIAVLMIDLVGWRASYLGVGLFLALIALPILLKLIAGRPEFTSPPALQDNMRPPRALDGLKIVASTRYFWLALPVLMYLSFVSTALIFHIEAVGAAKGWSRELVASSFGAFAVGHVAGLLLASDVVDRWTARVMMVLMNMPMFAGIAVLGFASSVPAAFVFMSLTGLSLGLVQPTVGAVWVEVYGTRRLGTIRSFAVVMMVVSSAAGPAVLGLGLDSGLSIETICAVLLAYGLAATILAVISSRIDVSAYTEGH